MKKGGVWFLVLLSCLSALTGFSGLIASADSSFSVAAKSAIAVDAASGKILYAQNATDSTTQIASVTKLLTAYLVYKKIDAGKLKWTDKIKISDYAYQLTQSLEASNIPMAQGESFTVHDLMNALLVSSANSAAVALAEHIAGSEPKFVDQMKAQLKDWGITDETLVNSSGLPNSVIAGHTYPGSSATAANTMSAADVAIISMHLLKEYPEVLTVTKQTDVVFDKGGKSQNTLYTTNQLLAGFAQTRSGVDGLKTGSTGTTIDCLAATTNQNDFRIITVVLGTTGTDADHSATFSQTNLLMNHVYANWQAQGIAAKGETLSTHKTIAIMDAKSNPVPLVLSQDFYVVMPLGNSAFSITFTDKSKNLSAPIAPGKTIATASVSYDDKLGYLSGYHASSVNLTVDKTVERANPFVVLWDHFANFVNEKL
ncbi:MAG: D-alanyl-D-alanine carboxypeptidase [Streptococcaceae bacterium]|jgi:D-alanyl-D-alanine carboxypeptidase (penicillin-binding protein 5/6)|nr:D-alanyl-D-alanine carboxypeptidase [Streptococcaceae bacterium]